MRTRPSGVLVVCYVICTSTMGWPYSAGRQQREVFMATRKSPRRQMLTIYQIGGGSFLLCTSLDAGAPNRTHSREAQLVMVVAIIGALLLGLFLGPVNRRAALWARAASILQHRTFTFVPAMPISLAAALAGYSGPEACEHPRRVGARKGIRMGRVGYIPAAVGDIK